MTTKQKIITGFSVMVLLVAAMAVVGYYSLGRSSVGFVEYNRLSRFNAYAGNINSAMRAIMAEMNLFMDTRQDAQIELALTALDSIADNLALSQTVVREPAREALLESMEKDVLILRELIHTVQTNLNRVDQQYRKTVLPSLRAMQNQLNDLSNDAFINNNIATMVAVTTVWETMSEIRAAIARYATSGNELYSEGLEQGFAQLSTTMDVLDFTVQAVPLRHSFIGLQEAFNSIRSAYHSMEELNGAAQASILQIRIVANRMTAAAHALSRDVGRDMEDNGANMLTQNSVGQMLMLGAGIGGLLLGLVFAIACVLSLVRVLRRLSRYAQAIASGQFDYDPAIREKGEIGGVVDALTHIPHTLKHVVGCAAALADHVSVGRFRNRIPKHDFDGEFSRLAATINMVCDSYTHVIDALPLGIMTCDKNRTVQFLNELAINLTGGESLEGHCSHVLGTNWCQNGDDCPGVNCMEHKASYQQETFTMALGERTDCTLITMPLSTRTGEVVGFMEIINDITAIKRQEETMRRVARSASEISDQVAASAQRLAAQVDQVSRGAQEQRNRMDLTASAIIQMNNSVMEVASNAAQASQQGELTRTNAVSGAQLVNDVVTAIRHINTVAARLQESMEALGSQAESIGSVINVISEITDQTNLLALNAAIEAARAGDAGRGFAVVADSVRQLAERTLQATQEVGASIKTMQHSARFSLQEVAGAVEEVNTATDLANASGEALQQIVALAEVTSGLIGSIATAAEEQSTTSEEIAMTVEDVNTLAGNTSNGMIQSAAAVQELSEMAQQLRTLLEELR